MGDMRDKSNWSECSKCNVVTAQGEHIHVFECNVALKIAVLRAKAEVEKLKEQVDSVYREQIPMMPKGVERK
jgi:hypothetical protein